MTGRKLSFVRLSDVPLPEPTRMGRIRAAFVKADAFHIVFVGETIIDEYRYVSSLGKSSKEFTLATVETGREEFEGGVIAAAKHGDWARVEVHTPAAAIRKTRFVDVDFNRKLFEVYDKRDLELHPVLRCQFEESLGRKTEKADVVIVTDFGHGLFGPTPRRIFEGTGHFLAVNAQSNAGNMGFNPVTKWSRADFICIDEPEARLATAMRDEPIPLVIDALETKIKCRQFLITHGKHGSYWRYPIGSTAHCKGGNSPALATFGVDTIGAGDAVLAVTAPLVCAGLDMESVALVGNVVGALKIGIVGHRRHVGRKEIMDKLEEVIG